MTTCSLKTSAVVGDGNTGKTSTIRALTGVGQVQRSWEVSFMVGERIERVATFVQPNGLQEKGIAPETFIQSVHEVGVRRVIVAVR